MNATDTAYETSDLLVVDLLNNAFITHAATYGYGTFRVETATTIITYTARPVERDGNGMPTRYAVLDAEHVNR